MRVGCRLTSCVCSVQRRHPHSSCMPFIVPDICSMHTTWCVCVHAAGCCFGHLPEAICAAVANGDTQPPPHNPAQNARMQRQACRGLHWDSCMFMFTAMHRRAVIPSTCGHLYIGTASESKRLTHVAHTRAREQVSQPPQNTPRSHQPSPHSIVIQSPQPHQPIGRSLSQFVLLLSNHKHFTSICCVGVGCLHLTSALRCLRHMCTQQANKRHHHHDQHIDNADSCSRSANKVGCAVCTQGDACPTDTTQQHACHRSIYAPTKCLLASPRQPEGHTGNAPEACITTPQYIEIMTRLQGVSDSTLEAAKHAQQVCNNQHNNQHLIMRVPCSRSMQLHDTVSDCRRLFCPRTNTMT